MRKTLLSLVCILASLTPTAAVAAPAPAAPGTRSLIEFLATDSGFDRNPQDFDVLDRYIRAISRVNPDGELRYLADGDRRATAFLPTDLAFSRLVRSVTGRTPTSERASWRAVRGLGLYNVERRIIYHVVLDRTITRNGLLAARGTRVGVLNGGNVAVYVRDGQVVLGDRNLKARNAVVTASNLNRGNKQVGHAIDRVMRPYGSGAYRAGRR
ncbi:fasciclin domain-containing protein [uncultured Nocardioides sp.]|uniref:fasciclin domain-containing protein n=1 Tax=uncultured Nocardioides sp. TaxID=198441 RepID=UPI00262C710F|nr:fasciclin domain-containing protein [uncultured Nocardioides sp.]